MKLGQCSKEKKALSNPWLFYGAYCRVFQIKESDAKVMECSCYEQPKIDTKLYILPHNSNRKIKLNISRLKLDNHIILP